MTLNPYVPQNSITDAVVQILKTDSHIIATGANVTADLVGYDPLLKWITVSRQGGSWAWPKHPHPRIDLQTIAPSRGEAEDLMEIALAVLLQQQDGAQAAGCRISAVRVETAPFESDDKLEGTCRYITAIRIVVTPVP